MHDYLLVTDLVARAGNGEKQAWDARGRALIGSSGLGDQPWKLSTSCPNSRFRESFD